MEGIDFIIDGHSHSVITAGPNGEAIQSTGTAFANIGVITIDNATKKIVGNELKGIWHKEKVEGKDVTVVDYKTRDEKVAAAAKAIIDPIDKAYGEKFAVSKWTLNGAKAPNGNRDSETNLGDLITDAMLWKIRSRPRSLSRWRMWSPSRTAAASARPSRPATSPRRTSTPCCRSATRWQLFT